MPDPSPLHHHDRHPSPEEIAGEVALAQHPPASAISLEQVESWLRGEKPPVAFVCVFRRIVITDSTAS